jgi:hypothetical protein
LVYDKSSWEELAKKLQRYRHELIPAQVSEANARARDYSRGYRELGLGCIRYEELLPNAAISEPIDLAPSQSAATPMIPLIEITTASA